MTNTTRKLKDELMELRPIARVPMIAMALSAVVFVFGGIIHNIGFGLGHVGLVITGLGGVAFFLSVIMWAVANSTN